MDFWELKPNNRVEIEQENDNPSLRSLRGIVLAKGDSSLVLVTDYGELVEVYEEKILSISSISMPKLVSDVMTDLKNHYAEIYELELQLRELREKTPEWIQKLFDANFLSRFNIAGAKNRLDKSIDPTLRFFQKDSTTITVHFESNQNSQIEIIIQVANQIDYPNLDEVRDLDKILRVHAPNIKEFLEKCFSFASKLQEINKDVIHEEESLYSVRTNYRINVDVTKDNFLEVRELIVKGLMKLQK